METQSLTIDVAGSGMPAYLARPYGGTPRPAVIVLQEIFGVNAEVKRITDLVASAEYVGLAINYYHRTHPNLNEPYTQEGLQNGFKAAGALTRQGLAADIAAAAAWLNGQSFVQTGRIATWGFCMGGTVAFFSATLPEVAAAVAFYGGNIAADQWAGGSGALADAAKIHAPLFLAFGGKDEYIPEAAREKIRGTLQSLGKSFEMQVYPEEGHAFFRESTSSMAAGGTKGKDVTDAWNRVKAFLKEHLSAAPAPA